MSDRARRAYASTEVDRDAPDAALIEAVVFGDMAAFAELYDRFGRPAYSLARRICGPHGLAEDVVEEAFTTIWRKAGRFDPTRGSVTAWVFTVVHAHAVDVMRRESRLRRPAGTVGEPGDEANAPVGAGADAEAIARVDDGQLRVALEKLTPAQREMLALAYFGGYTQTEIAATFGIPLDTVTSRTVSALALLRDCLGPLERG